MPDQALDARDIRKRYDSIEALKGVDLTARPGQVHGLLGPNGAGKTTLLRVLLGLTRRDAGTIQLLGTDQDDDAGLPEAVAGFVDTPAFYPYLSGRANLALLARLDGDGSRDRRQRLDAVLDQTGLASRGSTAVGRYSAGMRQRLGLASALLRRPRLLLLDEPTSAIDAAGARDVRTLLSRLASDGATVVFSSHDLASVEEICGTITILDRGRVMFAGTIDDVRAIAPDVHLLRTNQNTRAQLIAASVSGVRVVAGEDDSLVVRGDQEALDRYVIALGSGGVAIRHFERRARSLESLFHELTATASETAESSSGTARRQHLSVVGR